MKISKKGTKLFKRAVSLAMVFALLSSVMAFAAAGDYAIITPYNRTWDFSEGVTNAQLLRPLHENAATSITEGENPLMRLSYNGTDNSQYAFYYPTGQDIKATMYGVSSLAFQFRLPEFVNTADLGKSVFSFTGIAGDGWSTLFNYQIYSMGNNATAFYLRANGDADASTNWASAEIVKDGKNLAQSLTLFSDRWYTMEIKTNLPKAVYTVTIYDDADQALISYERSLVPENAQKGLVYVRLTPDKYSNTVEETTVYNYCDFDNISWSVESFDISGLTVGQAEGNVTASVTVTNEIFEEKTSPLLILAQYDENKCLAAVNFVSETVSARDYTAMGTKTLSLSAEKHSTAKTAVAYVWNSLAGQCPYMEKSEPYSLTE